MTPRKGSAVLEAIFGAMKSHYVFSVSAECLLLLRFILVLLLLKALVFSFISLSFSSSMLSLLLSNTRDKTKNTDRVKKNAVYYDTKHTMHKAQTINLK